MSLAEQTCTDARVSFVLPDNKKKELEGMCTKYFKEKPKAALALHRDDGHGRDNPLVRSDEAMVDDEVGPLSSNAIKTYVSSFVTIKKK